MTYVLAVDVGTSFTAAAVARFTQGASPVPECLPLGLRGTSVPSVLYYPEEGPVLVGEAAERRGLDSPDRIVREFKRRVGDAVPISAGTLSLPAEEVFATMARWVADRAAEREGEPPSGIILTHPAAWGSHRTAVVTAALAAKGLENVTLLTEPEAAALHYASQVRVDQGSTIAVYDLGGGTFDTAVLRKTAGDRFDPVGRPEGIEDLGGADFDAAVFRYVAEHTGGVLAGLDPAAPGVLAALSRLRRECVEAKEALSSDSETTIPVLLPGFQQQVRLVRSEFEALIEEPVRETVDALEESLAQLELEPADLTAVLLIGGSSRIPLVAELISEQLDRPIAVDADPKSSICLGAAVSAILSRAVAARDAAPAAAVSDAGTEGAGTAPETGAHGPVRPSWSRKGTTAAAAFAAAGHGPAHGHGGAHAPKPTVRLTAIAAAAALFTVLSATAAQSPGGFKDLASVFVPQAGADSGPPALDDSTGTETGAAAAGDAQPPAGIEAGVHQKIGDGANLNLEASLTNNPSSDAASTSSGKGAADPAAGSSAPDGGGKAPVAGSDTAPMVVPTPDPTMSTGPVSLPPGTPTSVPTSPGTPTETTNPSFPATPTDPPVTDAITTPPAEETAAPGGEHPSPPESPATGSVPTPGPEPSSASAVPADQAS
ncbi:Hsp70 family protein [Pseudarthrobacter enclensis]|uniref:Hsp70 family protein n=1 Tax=Pseudarthrobacter enclensis TaxID=993070 RepID=UPI0034342CE0